MSDQTTTPAPATATSRLGHAAIITPDLDRFRRFYEDVLGFRLVVISHPTQMPFRRLGAFTDRDGQAIVLLALEVPGYQSGVPDDLIGRRGRIDHIAFNAADNAEFEEIISRLIDAGASSGDIIPLGPTRSVVFVDPDGAHHNLQLTNPAWQPDSTHEVLEPELLKTLIGSGR